ncbi:MAG: TonB-dependent receptor [Acidobacteria bacterium]|nr:TonB-dependent receptor [Acidobacteriota bacterium]
MFFRVGLVILSCVLPASGVPGLTGTVRDAAGGERLARVKLTLSCGGHEKEARSDAEGRFVFEHEVGAGCVLQAASVGYRALRVEVKGDAELELALTPDTFTRREQVSVAAGPFEAIEQSSASERVLTGAEIKNLAAVLIDDPLRAAQALPGIASSNDYAAQFAVRGAAFQRTGIYLDGVLMHSPFHTVQSQEETGSLSIVHADLVDELVVHAGAVPTAYADRTAGALDLRLRDGSRMAPVVRLNVGVAASGLVAEGPLTKSGRGSWLAAVRKSYLQYLLKKSSAGDTLAFGFFDAEGRLTYDLDSRNQLTLSFMDGSSDLDRSEKKNTLGINSIMNADYHTTLANLGWRYAPSSSLMLTNRMAWIRERAGNRNNRDLPLGEASYGEWVANSSLVWNWSSKTPLQAGTSFRRLHDDGFSAQYNFNPLAVRRRDNWRATGLRGGGYLEQSWSNGPLRLGAGARFDGYSESGPVAVSPHVSATLRVARGTQVQAAWSQAIQYAPPMLLTIENTGNPYLLPERANHLVGAVEQSLGDRTRLRAEWFQRDDRDLIAQPLREPRMLSNGTIFVPPAAPKYLNSVHGRARGFEVFLQRRTANRVSGWISYGYTKTSMHDGVTGATYAADYEQRHTVNGYASYRITPTINLSGRYSYGSNFPIPGFLRQQDSLYYLSDQRNVLRLPAYHRADLRLNKSFHHETARGWSWRGVLYVEVMNLTSHENTTYDSFNGFNSRTGQAYPTFLKLFPIVPAAGLMLEWERGAKR